MDDHSAAPRWRSHAAGLLDVALLGAVAWLRGRGPGDAGARAGRLRFLRMIPAEALREQIGTPGQRLLGLRTVDRRTGERVALWRTLALTATAVGGQQLAQRVTPAAGAPPREHYLEELRAIHQRHPGSSPAREQELQALHAKHGPVGVDVARAVAPSLLAGLLTARLRRRFAPTVEVRRSRP